MNELLIKIITESATEKDFHNATPDITVLLDFLNQTDTKEIFSKFGLDWGHSTGGLDPREVYIWPVGGIRHLYTILYPKDNPTNQYKIEVIK